MNATSKNITAIIVDDEASARKSLQAFVGKYCPDVKVVGQAENIKVAKQLIDQLNPSLVFLDIEMPGGNAFDLLDEFDDVEFNIIFITAFTEYAVRAFEMSAAHYLLKPVSINNLVAAVDKVKAQLSNKMELRSSRVLLENMRTVDAQAQKIVLPLMDGFELVRLNEIKYIVAMDNFCQVYLSDKRRVTVCRKLKYFEEILGSLGYYRIHRSHMINCDFVTRYHKGKGGYVTMMDGKELDVSQSRKHEFLSTLAARHL